MQHIKHVIISAAGLGSRLGLNRPKCLVDIGDKKIIDYQLDLVKDIEDVRIVVGFLEDEVMSYVKKIRSDVTFVRNPEYMTTSNTHSIYLASRHLKNPYIIMDGDLLITKNDFDNFTRICKSQSVICVTPSKSTDAVFTKLNHKNEIVEFSRSDIYDFEWTGLAYIDGIELTNKQPYVFEEFNKYLPLQSYIINAYEIDTEADLELALKEWA